MSILFTYLKVFVTGGLLCLTAQLLIDKTRLTPARILVGYVCAGVILGATGIYEKIIGFASSGATVPLIGFGALLADGVRKSIDEQGAIGILTGGLSSAAAGITAVVSLAVIIALCFRSKADK